MVFYDFLYGFYVVWHLDFHPHGNNQRCTIKVGVRIKRLAPNSIIVEL